MIELTNRKLKRVAEVGVGELLMYTDAHTSTYKFALRINATNAPPEQQASVIVLDHEYEVGRRAPVLFFNAGGEYCYPLGKPVFEINHESAALPQRVPDLLGGELLVTSEGVILAARLTTGFRDVRFWNVDTGEQVSSRNNPEQAFTHWRMGVRNGSQDITAIYEYRRSLA